MVYVVEGGRYSTREEVRNVTVLVLVRPAVQLLVSPRKVVRIRLTAVEPGML
jgi:hypothetical protein